VTHKVTITHTAPKETITVFSTATSTDYKTKTKEDTAYTTIETSETVTQTTTDTDDVTITAYATITDYTTATVSPTANILVQLAYSRRRFSPPTWSLPQRR
jgi:hypothetical protein